MAKKAIKKGLKKALSRLDFVHDHPAAQAWASLKRASEQQDNITPGPVKLKPQCFQGRRALIVGAGVGGLTTAYELLEQNSGMQVTLLEANNRTGGRCLTLRTGDTLVEDANSDLFDAPPGQPQMVRFKRPLGDSEPYLNAGPGRIPSSHKRLLHYLKKFGVALEVYVMNSGANLTQMEGGVFDGQPVVYRRLEHNVNGWVAQMVYQNAGTLIDSVYPADQGKDNAAMAAALQSLMVSFGGLDENGRYVPTSNPDGQDETSSDRAGYTVLPGVDAGEVAKALGLDTLLESEFWSKTRFYQPRDFLWQPTLFQPVGGMDQVQHAFAQQVAALGGEIHLNSPVRLIDWDESTQEFVVHVAQIGTEEYREFRADVLFCNAAMPFLSRILSERLQGADQGLQSDFKEALQAVYRAQFEPSEEPDPDGYVPRFLACSTKVGWQAERSLWQGGGMTTVERAIGDSADKVAVLAVEDSELGVVPIFGGISWTDHPITQVWYPCTAYHDQLGTLTGCYNFSDNAYSMGQMTVEARLELARAGAAGFGAEFAAGLNCGVAIAWQNMPHIKGGWTQWHTVADGGAESVRYFNILTQGSGVDGGLPNFFIVGDQLSSLPGWQEGAIAAALNAISRLYRPDLAIPELECLPDTRLMVEGV